MSTSTTPEKEREALRQWVRYQHTCLHSYLPVVADRKVEGGPVTGFVDGDRTRSNLYDTVSNADRLLDHYLDNKDSLSGMTCTCCTYKDMMYKEYQFGGLRDAMPFTTHHRLLRRVGGLTAEASEVSVVPVPVPV